MVKVALVRCESYQEDLVFAAVKKGFDLIGGLSLFIKPGEKILLKPNMLVGDPPSKCSTTHPMVFKAVGKYVLEAGAKVTYGDSPGFGSPEFASIKTEIAKAAKELNIPLDDFVNGRNIVYEQGRQNKRFFLANAVLNTEGIVSLPKLKTHAFAKMTGAIKNQFGCIPGTRKAEFHVKLPDVLNFSRMLVDLNGYLQPRLYVMDGIFAMEGNGPRGGTPKSMKVLLFSEDPVALDATVCRMMHLNPEFVPTIVFGYEAGLGTYIPEDIELVGDALESFIDSSFRVNRDHAKEPKTNGIVPWFRNRIVARPVIQEKVCVRCGICVEVCPVKPKAIQWLALNNHPPVYHYNRCIRCLCCQELCPESAIHVKHTLLQKIISYFLR